VIIILLSVQVPARNKKVGGLVGGRFNQLNVTWLSQECGMTMINRDITHGSKILDRFFVSVPYIYCCRTFNSAVKTKHKAVLMSPVGNTLPTPIGVGDACSKRRCFDCREANIRKLRQAKPSQTITGNLSLRKMILNRYTVIL